jgi:hypothetical protein
MPRPGITCRLLAKRFPRSLVLAAVAWCTLTGVAPCPSDAKPPGYEFRMVAKLGDPAPGGVNYEFAFGPQDMNARDHVLFSSYFAEGEALYRRRRSKTTLIACSGQPAPGTSANFGSWGLLWPNGMNDNGESGLHVRPGRAECAAHRG